MLESTPSVSRILRDRFQSAPRFGHSSRFANLFSQNDDEFNEYIMGLLIVALLILSLFLLWGFLLLVFKFCLGRKRVGFLSGTPFEGTSASNPWILRGRIVFGISCLLFIMFSIVFVTAGLGNLSVTTTSIGYAVSVSFRSGCYY